LIIHLMKKVFGIWIIVLFLNSCSDNNNITIKGTYSAGSGEFLSTEMLNIAQTLPIDSVKVNNSGKFQFKFNLDHPELILLKNKTGEIINLLAFPDDIIDLDIPQAAFAEGYLVSGSDESVKIKSLVDKVEQTKFQLDSLSDAFDQIEDQEGPEAKVLITAYQQAVLSQKRNNIRFVIENITSLSSVYALYQRIAPETYILNELKDLQYFKIVADSIKVRYPESTLTSSLVMDVDRRVSEYNNALAIAELSKKNIPETGFFDLSIEDPDGKIVSLSSLKGKVVLINFWASWSSESRQSNNMLKTIYDKYHSRGFEVYSVGLENNRNNWRAAIDFEEYEWVDVSELAYPNSYAATVYNVKSIPTNYLMDREGNIVTKNLSGTVLATWLDNLL